MLKPFKLFSVLLILLSLTPSPTLAHTEEQVAPQAPTMVMPPWDEPFDSYPPTDWTEAQGTLGNPTTLSGTASGWVADTFSNGGSPSARINIYGTSIDEWMFTPQIELGAGPHSYQLEFDLSLTLWNGTGSAALGSDDIFAVVISTDGGTTWSSTNVLQQWDSSTPISNGAGDHIVIDLSSYTGTVQIGFYAFSDTSNADNDLFVDNVAVTDPTAPPACAIPTSPADTATNFDRNNDLNWAENGGAPTGYTLYFGTDTPPTNIENGTDVGNVTTFDPGTLNYGTTYYWQIVPYNANGSATGCAIWSFTTEADPTITPPWTEDFSAGYPPTNWTEAQGTLANPTTLSGTSSSWTQDGFANVGSIGSAKVNIWGTAADEWMFTPPIDLGTGSWQLEFDLALTTFAGTSATTLGTDDLFAVVMSTDGGATWSSTNILQQWDDSTPISNVGETASIDLSSYSGIVQLGFYGFSNTSNVDNDLFIDNVTIFDASGPPNCGVATSPADMATDVLNTTTLNWSSGGGAPTGYTLNFGTDGGGVSTPTNLVNGSDLGNTMSYDPSGLNYSTTYYWQVVPYNGNGSATSCPIWSFTTGADPIISTFPYSENFDGGIPLHWSIENTNGDSNEWTTNTTYRRGTSGGSLMVNYNSGQAMDDWLFTRPLSLTGGTTYGVRFYYQARSATFPESLEIAWGSSADSAGMTNGPIFSDIDFGHTSMLEAIATFTPSADGVYYVGFHGLSSANQFQLFLDDVTIYESPYTWAWEGTVDTNWDNGANWAGGIVPGPLDNVVISSGTPNDPTLDFYSESSYGPINNLTIDDGARLNLTTNSSLTINGTFTNNGTFAQTKNVPLGGPVTFLDYGLYGGVVMTPTSINMGNVTVAIQGNQSSCTTNAADALITRCFDITPTTPAAADILFYYTEAERNSQNASNLQLWHYDGPPGMWSTAGTVGGNSETGTTCTSGNCWLLVTGVSSYSPFTLGSGAVPTAVSLQTITATLPTLTWVLVTILLLGLTSLWWWRKQRG